MALTDVYEEMPADDKRAWSAMLARYEDEVSSQREYRSDGSSGRAVLPAVPDFTAETIQATFARLIADRVTFFSQRVDGGSKALSPNHVTNRPQGFGSKLILANLLGDPSNPFSHGRWTEFEYLRDLRRVIGKFMGRGDYDLAHDDLHQLAKYAQCYKRG